MQTKPVLFTATPLLPHGPGDWKRLPEFDRLLLFRALRPDRLTAAVARFVAGVLGPAYVASQAFDLERAAADAGPGTPERVGILRLR